MAFMKSFGATKVVTGSAHLLLLENGQKILIDCGMFQGENEEKNYKSFEFDAKEVDILILTHAHLDHAGRSPLLYKNGFRGDIIATEPTFELAEVILYDSAHVMREDYYQSFKKAQRRGDEKSVRAPLYYDDDVENFLSLPKTFATYNKEIKLAQDVSVVFYDAGHILGSSFVEISFLEDGVKKKIIFSGDLGNKNDLILPPLEYAKEANSLYIESTYGDRNHKDMTKSLEEFKNVITTTINNGGNVLIPSFAVERTQELLYVLKKMYNSHEIPNCRIFLDSPMAIRATQVYEKYAQLLVKECQDFENKDGSIFDFPALEYIKTIEESRKINDIEAGAIIIAGSGMCSGGRILHHLKHRVWNPKNALMFVGYQAKGTLGREIIDGAEYVSLYYEKIKISASIHTINGFSAHADQNQLIDWMEHFEKLENIYLIHGEEEKQIIFKEEILQKMKKRAHIVKENEQIFV